MEEERLDSDGNGRCLSFWSPSFSLSSTPWLQFAETFSSPRSSSRDKSNPSSAAIETSRRTYSVPSESIHSDPTSKSTGVMYVSSTMNLYRYEPGARSNTVQSHQQKRRFKEVEKEQKRIGTLRSRTASTTNSSKTKEKKFHTHTQVRIHLAKLWKAKNCRAATKLSAAKSSRVRLDGQTVLLPDCGGEFETACHVEISPSLSPSEFLDSMSSLWHRSLQPVLSLESIVTACPISTSVQRVPFLKCVQRVPFLKPLQSLFF